ncbi:hypothetical protein CN161_05735 [Sinorhizobium meliloti]|nr:hypothetical protein CN161_05735 [Sinorhizobium meliloti]
MTSDFYAALSRRKSLKTLSARALDNRQLYSIWIEAVLDAKGGYSTLICCMFLSSNQSGFKERRSGEKNESFA